MWSVGGTIIDTAKPKYSERNLSQCQSTTNPAWTEVGLKPGFRGVRPTGYVLSHGTAGL